MSRPMFIRAWWPRKSAFDSRAALCAHLQSWNHTFSHSGTIRDLPVRYAHGPRRCSVPWSLSCTYENRCGFHLEFTCADEHIVSAPLGLRSDRPHLASGFQGSWKIYYARQFGSLGPSRGGNRGEVYSSGDFDAFLESGILAHGFLRLRRTECAHEKLVAFFLSRPTPARFVLPPRSWKLTRACRARSSSAFRSRASTTSRTPRASRSWAV